MKKKFNIILFIGILCTIYLFTDIIHLILFRVPPIDYGLSEAFFEHNYISYLKWLFCLAIIIGIWFEKKGNRLSYFFILNSSIGILLLFYTKGTLFYLVKGHFLFNSLILEICGIVLFFYANFSLAKRYSFPVFRIVINYILITLFYLIIFSQLSPYA